MTRGPRWLRWACRRRPRKGGQRSAGPSRGVGRSGVGVSVETSPRRGSHAELALPQVRLDPLDGGPLGGDAPGSRSAAIAGAPARVRRDGRQPRAERLAGAAEDQHGLLAGGAAAEPAARRLGRQVLGADVFPALARHLVDRVGQRQRRRAPRRRARPAPAWPASAPGPPCNRSGSSFLPRGHPARNLSRSRASPSPMHSPPADWPCRRSPSSPGRRTSRPATAWPAPAPPCPGWPRSPPRPPPRWRRCR